MNFNSGTSWSALDLFDLREWLDLEEPIEGVAAFLRRDIDEVIGKADELGLTYTRKGRSTARM